MDDTYLDILKILQPYGIDREVDVSKDIYELFKNQPKVDPNEAPDNLNARIAHFCDEIHENRHIRLFKKEEPIDGITTWYVSMRLTYLGLQYLNEHRLTVSNINLNEAIRANFKYQLGVGIITLLAILTTACYSIATYYKVDSPTLKSISIELQRQSTSQEKILQSQKGIDTSLKKMVKKKP